MQDQDLNENIRIQILNYRTAGSVSVYLIEV